MRHSGIVGGFFFGLAALIVFGGIFLLSKPLGQMSVNWITPTVERAQWVSLLFKTEPDIPTTLELLEPLEPTAVVPSPERSATPPPVLPSSTPPPTHPGGCRTYVVKPGDVLSRIAEVFGVPLDDLLRANTIAQPDALQVEQTLIIPLDGCGLPTPEPTLGPTRIRRTATPVQVAMNSGEEAGAEVDLSQFRLYIPSLQINLPITRAARIGPTWDFSHITSQAAYLDGLPLPGNAANVVIGAHSELSARRPGPFYTLHRIQPGAAIIITYGGRKFYYVVERLWVVQPTDLGPIDQSAGDVLTLLTCDGYNRATGGYDTRLIVRAVRVE
jgi:LPXTG-site transpeptidase (sortase) family protein